MRSSKELLTLSLASTIDHYYKTLLAVQCEMFSRIYEIHEKLFNILD
jgi:hypothetical protein